MTMSELMKRLEEAGVPVDEMTRIAMEDVNPEEFTDFDLEPFWNDMPVPFLFTGFGATRTISAPHMIVTLLHHLEIIEGSQFIGFNPRRERAKLAFQEAGVPIIEEGDLRLIWPLIFPGEDLPV